MIEKEQPYTIESISEIEEGEPDPRASVTDVVRHGQTDYKELKDPDFKFNPDSPDFKLDTTHLDLTQEGIKNIQETAEQLAGVIDKDNEAIILITSPNFRAHSSMLLIEKVLQDRGVTILNPSEIGKLKTSKGLEQIKHKDPNFRPTWIEADTRYRQKDPANIRKKPRIAHKEIAESLGTTVQDTFVKDHEAINKRFENWLRHMINIDYYLSDETKQALIKGDGSRKKIRVICVTHEEVPDIFLEQSLGAEQNLQKGQVLEVQPQNLIERDKKTTAKVKLYEKGESKGSEGNISIGFYPKL